MKYKTLHNLICIFLSLLINLNTILANEENTFCLAPLSSLPTWFETLLQNFKIDTDWFNNNFIVPEVIEEQIKEIVEEDINAITRLPVIAKSSEMIYLLNLKTQQITNTRRNLSEFEEELEEQDSSTFYLSMASLCTILGIYLGSSIYIAFYSFIAIGLYYWYMYFNESNEKTLEGLVSWLESGSNLPIFTISEYSA